MATSQPTLISPDKTRRDLDEAGNSLTVALLAAIEALDETLSIHECRVIPFGYRATPAELGKLRSCRRIIGAIKGFASEEGTTTEQQELLDKTFELMWESPACD